MACRTSGEESAGVSSSATRDVQFLAAGLVEELQFGLAARQFDFDFGAARMAGFDAGAQLAQDFIGGGEGFAMAGFLLGHFEHGALGCGDLFGERR